MNLSSENIGVYVLLLMGLPGIGKTTVIRKVFEGISGKKIRGFTTEEIRAKGERKGFRIESFDGKSEILAHVEFSKTHRVGKYGVDISALEKIVETSLKLDENTTVYLIDEIGKMECLSKRFVESVTLLLDSKVPLVATISTKGGGFIEKVKQRSDVEVWEVTKENRDELPEKVIAWLSKKNP